jgi:hypothetical protein
MRLDCVGSEVLAPSVTFAIGSLLGGHAGSVSEHRPYPPRIYAGAAGFSQLIVQGTPN